MDALVPWVITCDSEAGDCDTLIVGGYMGHNGQGINLYGVVMIFMGNLHAGGQSNLGHLSLVHRHFHNYT